MRSAPLHDKAGINRVTYFDFVARRLERVTPVDVVEFEPVEYQTGIDVIEERFDSMEELMSHVRQVVGELA